MSKIGNAARFAASPVLAGLFCLLNTGSLRAQEIRVIADPNQSIRMGRGGYVCDGQLTHAPIDATENWTYEMVQCTGPMYNSFDYAALHAKLNHDEMLRLNETMDRLLDLQSRELNRDLKANIESSFQALPHDVLISAEVQMLKRSLLDYVDQRVGPEVPPLPPHTRPAPTTPKTHPRTASPPTHP